MGGQLPRLVARSSEGATPGWISWRLMWWGVIVVAWLSVLAIRPSWYAAITFVLLVSLVAGRVWFRLRDLGRADVLSGSIRLPSVRVWLQPEGQIRLGRTHVVVERLTWGRAERVPVWSSPWTAVDEVGVSGHRRAMVDFVSGGQTWCRFRTSIAPDVVWARLEALGLRPQGQPAQAESASS